MSGGREVGEEGGMRGGGRRGEEEEKEEEEEKPPIFLILTCRCVIIINGDWKRGLLLKECTCHNQKIELYFSKLTINTASYPRRLYRSSGRQCKSQAHTDI